ncbi:MAG: PKD domain-containing protein [Candidatus Cloacimonetes bacterium]|nr:PKD domain-containing protein [Candidatus Cloacimonadota bacterium]
MKKNIFISGIIISFFISSLVSAENTFIVESDRDLIVNFEKSREHFTPVWSGNPYQPMNIFISSATIDGINMVAGDEIAVFDVDNSNEICVGSVVLEAEIPPTIDVIASTDDPDTPDMDGFIDGHTIIYRLWDDSEETEIIYVTPSYHPDYDEVFTSFGTALVDLEGLTQPPEPSAILPDIIVDPGESFSVPLTVNDLVELEGMDIVITFEEDVIDATGATLSGGVLEGWNYGFQVNTTVDGQITLVFYAQVDLFSGSGVVAYLEFDAVCSAGDSTPLTFTQFDVNEVSYLDNVTNGSVTCEGVPQYTITTTPNPPEGGSTTGDGIYEEGTECTVIATPNTGWNFINWTEDGVEVSTDEEYTFIVESDRDLVANFLEMIPPTASFTAEPTEGYAPLEVTFTNTSDLGTGDLISYLWEFGDGDTSSEENPIHEYIDADIYEVTLTVTTTHGNDTSPPTTITVYETIPPTASFTAEPTEGYAPLEVTFTNTSDLGTGDLISYLWEFGDGDTSSEENPIHEYIDADIYEVTLTVTTTHGNDTSLPTTITVYETIPPTASFTSDPTEGYAPLEVTFTNTSDPGTGSAITYLWNFGDGDISFEENPIHEYTDAGVYEVTLTVTTTHGTDTSPPTMISVYLQPSAMLPDTTVDYEESFSIPLIVNNLVNLEGMDIIIIFEQNVIDATGATLEGGILEDENYALVVNPDVDGQITLVFYAEMNLFSGSGVVAYLEFDAVGSPGDSTPLTFTQFDVDEVSYLENVTNGSVSLEGIGIDDDYIPTDFALDQNYPNPFSRITSIKYSLPKPSNVKIQIYNVKGQLVEILVNDDKEVGVHFVNWNANDVSPGVYFYIFEIKDKKFLRKMIVLK